MHIRPKTKRRLLILFGICLLIGGALASAVVMSNHRIAAANKKLRQEAMASYVSGDYAKAIELLQNYRDKIAADDPDVEVEFAFGKSCAASPLPVRQHDGIHTFEHYLQALKPGDLAAQHELIKLYVNNGYNVEAVHLADEILAANGRDPEALQQKVFALWRQHSDKPELALAVNQALNEIDPLNLPAQIYTLQFMRLAKASDAAIIAHAEKLLKAHEKDKDPVRFELLLGIAHLFARQQEQAVKWFRTAAGRAPTDVELVGQLAGYLDSVRLYPEAAAYLAKAAETLPDPAVQYLYVQRLWQDQRFTDLVNHLKQRQSANPAADNTTLLGFLALALHHTDKTAEARALIEPLKRRNDPRSSAWALALAATLADPPLKPADAVAALQQALSRDYGNSTLHALLANAFLMTGETELAIQQCELALQLAPGWAEPFAIEARAMLASHRTYDALAKADEAYRRAPAAHETNALLATARFEAARASGLASEYVSLLPLLEYIQKAWQDSDTLPMYVTALSRSGKREEAIAAVKAALTADPPLSTRALTSLSEVADAEQLGVGQEVRDFTRKTRGLTPDLALAQARALLREGKGNDGLLLLSQASKGHETELAWRIIFADYREIFSPADALRDWIVLGDQYPADPTVQNAILSAASHENDRAFWARTIERLKALTGEQGQAWRIERSDWLLSGDLNERDIAEAINLLTPVTHAAPHLARPHLLLARALEKVGKPRGAIDELRAAAAAQPGDPAITRELVRLLMADKRPADALEFLDKLTQNSSLAPLDRAWLVSTFVELDASDKAVDVLEKSHDFGIKGDAMLARLYHRVGRLDEAAELYRKLAPAPIAEPAFWVEGANFLAGWHDMATAHEYLEKLALLPLPPGEIEVHLAQFSESWKSAAEALPQYQTAVKVAPKSAAAWLALTRFYIRQRQFSEAAATAAEGLKAVPGEPTLSALRSAAAALSKVANAGEFARLIEALWRNPQDAGAIEMLAVVTAGGNLVPAELARIAGQHRDNLLLQTQAVQTLVHAGQSNTALELALAAAAANPKAATPQRLLTILYSNSGDWSNAEKAALLWRQYALDQPLPADLALATIYLQQPNKDAAGALRALKPYMSAAAPARFPQATLLYCKALLLADRAAEAAAMLKPLLADSADWREKWLELACLQKNVADASAWIAQAAPLISQENPAQRLALAAGWYAVGEHFASSEALETASQIVEPLLAADQALPQAWLVAGQLAMARSNYPAAENAYRQVVKLDPKSADGRNNLAYALWVQGRDENLAEARQLAEAAIAAHPEDARFCDTLARILARAGDRPGAIRNFRSAIVKDPNSLEAMIGLADLLSRDPATRQEAKDLIARVRQFLAANPRLPAVVRKQYDGVREALATSL